MFGRWPVVVGMLALAGCGSGAHEPASTPPASSAPATPTQAAGTTVAVRTSKLGRYLVDGAGRALYLFEKDKPGRSACYGACAKV